MALADLISLPGSTLPDGSGIEDALARNAALGQQQQRDNPRGLKFGSPIRNFLGAIGDALLVSNGIQPMYRERLQQQQQQDALSQYLGPIAPDLAALVGNGVDIGDAAGLYKVMHPEADSPETIQLLRAAGIDPASEEGKAIIAGKLRGGGDQPNFVRELEALGINPRSKEALELYYGRNSPPGYLLKPPGGSSAESLPAVNSQTEYDALPPGARYRDSQGNVGVKGGQTAAPSGDFR